MGYAAHKRLARLEDLLPDPVYTAKVIAGMLSEIERGHLGKSDRIIFLHTGGLPVLFAFPEKIF